MRDDEREPWQPEPEAEPPRLYWYFDGRMFDGDAELWIKNKLSHRVNSAEYWSKLPHLCEYKAALIDWYQENFERFVWWYPSSEYGHGKPAGSWQFNEHRFVAEWPEIMGLVQRAAHEAKAKADAEKARIEAASFQSLDEWLRADIRGEIKIAAGGGSKQLTGKLRDEMSSKAYRRRRQWPKNCSACGELFQPKSLTVARCDACRAARKAAPLKAKPITKTAAQKPLSSSTVSTTTALSDYERGRADQRQAQTTYLRQLAEEMKNNPPRFDQ